MKDQPSTWFCRSCHAEIVAGVILQMTLLKMNSRTRLMMRFLCALLTVLVLSLAPAALADKKKQVPQTAEEEAAAAAPKIDTSQLVWPRPPDVARIRWLGQFKGEPAPDAPTASAKKKQKWMDRLAGKRQIDEIKAPHPHILIEPNGVAVDSKGKHLRRVTLMLVLSSFSSTEVEKVNFIHNGREVHFEQIIGLAMDDNDRLFVSDSHLKTIFVFDPAHRLVGSFGADSLERPSGIALDTKNRLLYVTDVVKNHVAVFDADTFKFQRAIGGPPEKPGDEDPGTFARPTNVAVDGKGAIYVSDTINNRIQIFDDEGNFLSIVRETARLGRPGAAVDRDGHIRRRYPQWTNSGFDRKGQLAGYFGMHGTLPGQFQVAAGVAIDSQNRDGYGAIQRTIADFRYITERSCG